MAERPGVWVALGDCGHGYCLIGCARCGEVHAIDVLRLPGGLGEIDTVLIEWAAQCGSCGAALAGAWKEYPRWFWQGGRWWEGVIPTVYPPDEQSALVSFWSVTT